MDARGRDKTVGACASRPKLTQRCSHTALGGMGVHAMSFAGPDILPQANPSGTVVWLEESNEVGQTPTNWVSHPSGIGYRRTSPGITTTTGSGSSASTSQGPPLPGNAPSMDTGLSDGGTTSELNRLTNFNAGGNQNPTAMQPGPISRSQQLALPMFTMGSPGVTNLLLTDPDAGISLAAGPFRPTADESPLATVAEEGDDTGSGDDGWFWQFMTYMMGPSHQPPGSERITPAEEMDRQERRRVHGKNITPGSTPLHRGDTTDNAFDGVHDTITNKFVTYAAVVGLERAIDALAPEEHSALFLLEKAGKIILKPLWKNGKRIYQIWKKGKGAEAEKIAEEELKRLINQTLKNTPDDTLKQASKAAQSVPGEVRGYWQKQFQNGRITEEELRKMLPQEDVAEILKNLGQKAGKIPHEKAKIIESIQKSTDAYTRAAEDLAKGKITQEEFDEFARQFEEISKAQSCPANDTEPIPTGQRR